MTSYPETMTIPEIREELQWLAKRGHCLMTERVFAEKVSTLADKMYRKSPVRRAPRKLAPLDAEQKEKIRLHAILFPAASQLEIANIYGTNPGRVSEALNEGR